MKKNILLVSCLVLMTRLDAEGQLSEEFAFKHKQTSSMDDDVEGYVGRTSVMSQLKDFHGPDADMMDEAALRKLAATQRPRMTDIVVDQSDSEQKSKQSQLNLFARCQQFFMNIFAFLYKK